jgi:lysophospholipase L1-like esterase
MTAMQPMGRREAADPYVASDAALAGLLRGAPWRQVVALGDSVVQGVREAVRGYCDRSWLDRLGAALTLAEPATRVHNLGLRDLTAAQVRSAQLGPALGLRPDLAIVVAGGNDLLRRSFDPAALHADLVSIIAPLRMAGAEVLTMDLWDITVSGHVDPRHRDVMRERLDAYVSVARAVSVEQGTLHARLRDHPAATDPSVFSSDGLHLNARGHAIVAAGVARRLAAGVRATPGV